LALQAVAVAVLVALVGIFAHGLRSNSTTVAAELNDGKAPAAPGFTLPTLDGGGTVDLHSLRGNVVVLNFWASWCQPCRDEAPIFAEELHRHAAQGLRIVGVDSQDFPSDARTFARRFHVTAPCAGTRAARSPHRSSTRRSSRSWAEGRSEAPGRVPRRGAHALPGGAGRRPGL
jgi:cytochrome c biogenesis protein CcmG/thiol:disulfide interchange protein DsbE